MNEELTPTATQKINLFEHQYRGVINLFIKPALGTIAAVAIACYTLWLNANYVQQGEFKSYNEKQEKTAEAARDLADSQNKLLNAKLETIINNQAAYQEQVKSFNATISNLQKQMDRYEDRIIYLERKSQ